MCLGHLGQPFNTHVIRSTELFKTVFVKIYHSALYHNIREIDTKRPHAEAQGLSFISSATRNYAAFASFLRRTAGFAAAVCSATLSATAGLRPPPRP